MKFGVGHGPGPSPILMSSSPHMATRCPASTYTVPFLVATLLFATLSTILLVTHLWSVSTPRLLLVRSNKSPSRYNPFFQSLGIQDFK